MLNEKNATNQSIVNDQGGGFTVGGGAESTLFSSGMAEFDENFDGMWNLGPLSETENWVFLVRKNGI